MMSKRKLTLSCIALSLSLIIACINTFAWFTTNSKNKIDDANFTQPEDGAIEFVLGGKGNDEFALMPGELITLELKISNSSDNDCEISILLKEVEISLPTMDSDFRYSQPFIDSLCYYKDDSIYNIKDSITFNTDIDDLLEYNDFFAKFVSPVSNALRSEVFFSDINKKTTIASFSEDNYFTTGLSFGSTNLAGLPNVTKLYEINKPLNINTTEKPEVSAFYLDTDNKLIVKGNTKDATLYLKVYFDPSVYSSYKGIELRNSNPYLMQEIKASVEVELIN